MRPDSSGARTEPEPAAGHIQRPLVPSTRRAAKQGSKIQSKLTKILTSLPPTPLFHPPPITRVLSLGALCSYMMIRGSGTESLMDL